MNWELKCVHYQTDWPEGVWETLLVNMGCTNNDISKIWYFNMGLFVMTQTCNTKEIQVQDTSEDIKTFWTNSYCFTVEDQFGDKNCLYQNSNHQN